MYSIDARFLTCCDDDACMLFVVRSIGGEVTTDGDFLIFEGNRYNRKGFLFKSFVMSAIVSAVLLYQPLPHCPVSGMAVIVWHYCSMSQRCCCMALLQHLN